MILKGTQYSLLEKTDNSSEGEKKYEAWNYRNRENHR